MAGFEFGWARPDQVSTERLHEARAVLSHISELDPSAIDSLTLADSLQGLSRAVSDIVLARGEIVVLKLSETPSFDPAIMPAEVPTNVLIHYDDPNTRTGRMFDARPIWKYGAAMSVCDVDADGEIDLYEAFIPSDQMIDEILLQEPALWNNMFTRSQDFRSGQSVDAYPFHARFYDERSPSRYLSTVQELSAELLTISA